jgi:hypothetical protein
MGLTLTNLNRNVTGNRRNSTVTAQFDDSYPTGGESLTPTQLGMHKIESVQISIDPAGGDSVSYAFGWDATNEKVLAYYAAIAGTINTPAFTGTAPAGTAGVITDSNDAATLGHAIYVLPAAGWVDNVPTLKAEASATGLIKDQDSPGTPGVALYVVVDDPNWSSLYQLGHFEFVSPTDANGTCTIATGDATLLIYDDDNAASNGVAVRAVAASGGLEATTAAAKDIIVPVSNGKFIHINHATTGSTPALYFDEDAANTYERIIAEVVDNADEPYSLFISHAEADADIVKGRTQLGALRLGQLVTVGPKSFKYTVGSGGPEITVSAHPEAATLAGATALTVAAAGAGLQSANFGGEDVFIPTSTGEYLKVAYAASPAGPQVYSYPEGATADLTLQAVVVDDADETIATEAAIGAKRDTPAGTIGALTLTGTDAALTEVAAGVDLQNVYVFISATGW